MQWSRELVRLCRLATAQCQQIRHAVIMKRVVEPPLAPKGTTPYLQPEHFRYRLVDYTGWHKKTPLELVMLKDLEGIGSMGDVVKVNRGLSRNFLIPNGYATYATPDVVAEYAKYRQGRKTEVRKSVSSLRLMRSMSYMHLPVPMSNKAEWSLTASHLRVALRLVGIEVPVENIHMPAELITEPGRVEFGVEMNDQDMVRVQGTVFLQTPAGLPVDEGLELPPVFIDTTVPLGEKPPEIVQWQPSSEHGTEERDAPTQTDKPSS